MARPCPSIAAHLSKPIRSDGFNGRCGSIALTTRVRMQRPVSGCLRTFQQSVRRDGTRPEPESMRVSSRTRSLNSEDWFG